MTSKDFLAIPEGGRFRQVFRSERMVTVSGEQSRTALSHIYYTLNPGEVSRFHRLCSDEIWSLY